ncbi:TlpA family protein disulfide reductase [Frateuria terrea]|uniref:Thiol-disulfide isomerase or thioredoxin n=1 Tax=Frateuria terrea TaxID=529704 RepID=A0A1H6W2U1_9GAMM|nr:TlpA disulfide reductase family protein [Frateuria terrea]SEJ10166.1 Thiol-disulfide isomerase or thioredoxin [Frateuria terrea]SFP68014.1 Thiol-disulfide isomerase or thioredoxin [Frateuria terrea]
MKISSLALAACLLVAAATAQAAMPAQPSLKVTTLDGKPFDLAAQRGHWVIVNFWATWCVPCIKEMPDISRFVSSHADVRAVGLAYEDSDKADIQAFLAKHPVSYPIAQVTMDDAPKDFDEPRGLPTTYLIAPDGHVAKRFVGPVTGQSLGAAIGK